MARCCSLCVLSVYACLDRSEEKRAAEESYARDLAQLESMLQQAACVIVEVAMCVGELRVDVG